MLKLKADFATPADSALIADLIARAQDGETAGAIMEQAGVSAVQDHLLTTYVPRTNKLGGRSTGFWKQAYEATRGGGSGDFTGTVLIEGPRGIRLRYRGGTVRPSGRTSEVTGRPIRFLSIPIAPEAHGVAVKEFPGGVRREGRNLVSVLTGRPVYALARRTRHKADKGILPSPAEFAKAVAEPLVAFIKAQEETQGGNPKP